MISRLMLSLKKASRAKESGWTSDALSGVYVKTLTQIDFGDAPNSSGGTTSDEVALSDPSDEGSGERSCEPGDRSPA